MAGDAVKAILDYLIQSRDLVQAAIDDPEFVAVVRDIAAEAAATAIGSGRKLLLAGNGGSAADAQHLAAEMLSRLNYDRAPAAALALTTDTWFSRPSATTTATTDSSSARSSVSAAPEMSSSPYRRRAVRRTFCARSTRRENSGLLPWASPAEPGAKCLRAAICAYGRPRIRHH